MKSGFWRVCLFAFGLMMPGMAQAQDNKAATCATIKPFQTEILVSFLPAEPVYDLTKRSRDIANSNEALQRWLQDNIVEAAWQANEFEFGGLGIGGWGLISSFDIQSASVDKFGVYYCPYVKQVKVDIIYRALMLIDSNTPVTSCSFELVKNHMLVHHESGKEIIEKYVRKMYDDLSEIANEMEARSGYVSGKEIRGQLDAMESGLSELVRVVYKDTIAKEMLKTSMALDTDESRAALRMQVERCRLGLPHVPEHDASKSSAMPTPQVNAPSTLDLNIK